jgi:hypothetical protein
MAAGVESEDEAAAGAVDDVPDGAPLAGSAANPVRVIALTASRVMD